MILKLVPNATCMFLVTCNFHLLRHILELYKCKFILTACPEISHCLENHCTALGNNHCVKCDGEVKPDPPFWAAYTRRPSVNKLCQRTYVYLKHVYIYYKYIFHTIQNLDINISFCLIRKFKI